MKKHKAINIHATPQDIEMANNLREKHGINISGMFKVFLYHLEKKLNELDYESGIKKIDSNKKYKL